MHKHPRDFLLTYDPSYVERHSDSSDFEDTILPTVASKTGNHCLLNKKKKKQTNLMNNFNQQIFANLYTDLKRHDDVKEEYVWETETVHTSKTYSKKELTATHKGLTKENFNRGDEVETIRSKRSLFRHKVIPCLSSMFGRSSNTAKPMMIIKENQPEKRSADSGSQVEHMRRQERNYTREQCYAIQPVYTVEGNIHGISMPFEETKLTQPIPKYCKCKNKYSNSSLSLTSSSGRGARKKLARKEFKERLHSELKKEYVKHLKGNRDTTKNQEQQCMSKPSKSSYQVYQHMTRSMATTPTDSCTRLPSTASGFWDYICDKLNRKYPVQPVELQQYGCTCSGPTADPACSPDNCTVLQASRARPEAPGCCNRGPPPPPSNDNSNCCCNPSAAQEFMGKCYAQNPSPPQGPPHPPPLPTKPGPPPYQYASKKKDSEKVECQCYPEKGKQPSIPSKKSPASISGSSQPSDSKKPCQEPHNTVTSALASKYNGEILCIHNPPCVLINGCLNLPPPKEQAPISLWPVTQGKKNSFYHIYRKNKRSKRKCCDQSCQYHTPYVEVQQCQTSFYKDEKITQSMCNHNPPCEMVRSCYKDKYNPKLMNSCIHVPVCDKETKHSFEKHRQSPPKSIDRSPRNGEVPITVKNYTVMTATGTVGTQVKPKDKVCRHKPACPKIPKCLDSLLCDSYIAMQGIPMCGHDPSCEAVPTCCKKTPKEMAILSSTENGISLKVPRIPVFYNNKLLKMLRVRRSTISK